MDCSRGGKREREENIGKKMGGKYWEENIGKKYWEENGRKISGRKWDQIIGRVAGEGGEDPPQGTDARGTGSAQEIVQLHFSTSLSQVLLTNTDRTFFHALLFIMYRVRECGFEDHVLKMYGFEFRMYGCEMRGAVETLLALYFNPTVTEVLPGRYIYEHLCRTQVSVSIHLKCSTCSY